MKIFITLSILFSVIAPKVFADEGTSQADMEFMRMLQAKAAQSRMEEEFKNPKKPVIEKGRAVLGSAKAPITIVAYSDFQCPYCKMGFERMEEVKKKYGDKIRFVFKHLPLPFHPFAMPAAKRFEAINMQGGSKKAYKYHDIVFSEQNKLSSEGEAFLDDAAKRAGANVAKMKKDMESDKVKKQIDADMAEAHGYKIDGTPGFIVAGVTVSGAQPMEAFSQIIDQRLSERSISSAKKKKN